MKKNIINFLAFSAIVACSVSLPVAMTSCSNLKYNNTALKVYSTSNSVNQKLTSVSTDSDNYLELYTTDIEDNISYAVISNNLPCGCSLVTYQQNPNLLHNHARLIVNNYDGSASKSTVISQTTTINIGVSDNVNHKYNIVPLNIAPFDPSDNFGFSGSTSIAGISITNAANLITVNFCGSTNISGNISISTTTQYPTSEGVSLTTNATSLSTQLKAVYGDSKISASFSNNTLTLNLSSFTTEQDYNFDFLTYWLNGDSCKTSIVFKK